MYPNAKLQLIYAVTWYQKMMRLAGSATLVMFNKQFNKPSITPQSSTTLSYLAYSLRIPNSQFNPQNNYR
jgi:hypothetical protein